MNQEKAKKLSTFFSYICFGFAILNIPFSLIGSFVIINSGVKEYFNLIDSFRYSSLTISNSDLFTLLSVILLVAVILPAVSSVLELFKIKTSKIIAAALFLVSLIADIYAIFNFCLSDDFSTFMPAPGFGIIVSIIVLIVALVFSILSIVFFCISNSLRVSSESDFSGVAVNGFNSGLIEFLSGSCCGYRIPVLPGKDIVIGKDPSICSVVIDKRYSEISRKHCKISFEPNQNMYIVTDFSSNGTYSENGIRLNTGVPARIRRGTVITLAKTNNIFILK